mmetsp:Transcript_32211/g.102539  ORF Transcript_32211/g.102539 Transcript_32211/m.102539 type:complete len:212 (+) Transcript_32211:833-1468(+)
MLFLGDLRPQVLPNDLENRLEELVYVTLPLALLRRDYERDPSMNAVAEAVGSLFVDRFPSACSLSACHPKVSQRAGDRAGAHLEVSVEVLDGEEEQLDGRVHEAEILVSSNSVVEAAGTGVPSLSPFLTVPGHRHELRLIDLLLLLSAAGRTCHLLSPTSDFLPRLLWPCRCRIPPRLLLLRERSSPPLLPVALFLLRLLPCPGHARAFAP